MIYFPVIFVIVMMLVMCPLAAMYGLRVGRERRRSYELRRVAARERLVRQRIPLQ